MLLYFKKEKSVKISEINSVFNRRVIAEFLKSNNQSQVCFCKKWRETLIASPFIKRKKRIKQLCTEDPAGGAVALPVKLRSCSGLQDAASASQAWMLAKSLNLFSKLWKWSQCCLFPFINMEYVSVFLSVGKKKKSHEPLWFQQQEISYEYNGALPSPPCCTVSSYLHSSIYSSSQFLLPYPLPPSFSFLWYLCSFAFIFPFHHFALLLVLLCGWGEGREGDWSWSWSWSWSLPLHIYSLLSTQTARNLQ